MKILFASAEVSPLAKTGGLGEVCGALPPELHKVGHDVRIALPGYRVALAQCRELRHVAQLSVIGSFEPVQLLETVLPGSSVPVWLVDAPGLFDRPGGLYAGPDGRDFADNANRYAVFCRAVVEMAMDRAGLYWRPDVVHCHDWQSGLVPPLLTSETRRPGTVFTVHNLAYSGSCDRARFETLQLPAELFAPTAMEFYGQFSFIKGGLVFADQLTTVSPTYAQEIRTPEMGFGLDGVIRQRQGVLTGILNGVDYRVWNPEDDRLISARYNRDTLDRKTGNKQALQADMGLQIDDKVMLFGVVSRLAYQKGIDLLPSALGPLWSQGVQLAILGSGDAETQGNLARFAENHAGACATYFGYHETLSHRIIAGCDALLMPSRYEPCGLSQLYAQRYGTVPIVRRTGGLSDTVVPANAENIESKRATGILFDEDRAEVLSAAMLAGLYLYRAPEHWREIQRAGMEKDFGWSISAQAYMAVYQIAAGSGSA